LTNHRHHAISLRWSEKSRNGVMNWISSSMNIPMNVVIIFSTVDAKA
jgi:hypothetical protein